MMTRTTRPSRPTLPPRTRGAGSLAARSKEGSCFSVRPGNRGDRGERSDSRSSRPSQHHLCFALLVVLGLWPVTPMAAIVGGSQTSAYGAVGFWVNGFNCSAVVVHRVLDQVTALSSASCVTGADGTLRLGEDYASPDQALTVTNVVVHPNYSGGSDFDVAVLEASGAAVTTETLPLVGPAEDVLDTASGVILVGYGQTEGGANTERHAGATQIDELGSTTFSTTGGAGACFGDLGGAVISDDARSPVVVGLISAGDCTVTSTLDVRASSVFDFVQAVVNGTEIPIFKSGFEIGSTELWTSTTGGARGF